MARYILSMEAIKKISKRLVVLMSSKAQSVGGFELIPSCAYAGIWSTKGVNHEVVSNSTSRARRGQRRRSGRRGANGRDTVFTI